MIEEIKKYINFPITIKEQFDYPVAIDTAGLYSISISARVKSGKQINSTDDEDLQIEIDGRKFTRIPPMDKPQYKDIPPAFNGSKLKGLKKTAVFFIWLEKGSHIVSLIPDRSAIIENAEVEKKENIQNITLAINEQAEDGDRRPWFSFIFINLSVKEISISIIAQSRWFDRDDAQIKIDGEIQSYKNGNFLHKFWHWIGSLLKGKEETAYFNPNLSEGLHYIEINADRMPTLNRVVINLGDEQENQEKNKIQKYDQFHGISGKEDYNRFDDEIIKAVDYWNDFFAKQEYPPNELLDYNLVKAIIYRESRVGYEIGGEIDVMQVGNEKDPALRTLNNDGWINPLNNIAAREYEIQNGAEEILDYGGEAQVKIIQDSIYWGVRWLYHKAQGITNEKKRYWRSWKDAVLGYGPGTAEYVDYIWRVYKEGKDFNGKVENVLWIKTEEGFTVSKIMIGIGIILVAGFLMYCLNIKLLSKSSNGIVKGVSALQEIYGNVDKIFLNDLETYKKGGIKYGDFFENTLKECEQTGCIKQSVVYDKYKLIIKNMKDNKHFLSAMGSLGADNNFYLNDIDNDGENEIIFLIYDPLNRDHINISVIDKIDGKFELVEKKIEWGHSGHLAVLDLTGDLKPEIISYISFGKGGESLFVCQYNYPEFKEIFNVRDFLFPEYTFSDMDNNGKMEIRVIGEGVDKTIIKRVYEYDPDQNSFILIDNLALKNWAESNHNIHIAGDIIEHPDNVFYFFATPGCGSSNCSYAFYKYEILHDKLILLDEKIIGDNPKIFLSPDEEKMAVILHTNAGLSCPMSQIFIFNLITGAKKNISGLKDNKFPESNIENIIWDTNNNIIFSIKQFNCDAFEKGNLIKDFNYDINKGQLTLINKKFVSADKSGGS